MPCDSTTSGPCPVTSYAMRAPLTSMNSVMTASLPQLVTVINPKVNDSNQRCQGASRGQAGEALGGRKAVTLGQIEGPADDLLHDLARATVDADDAGVDERPGDLVLEHVAVPAVELHAGVDDPAEQFGGPELGLGGV